MKGDFTYKRIIGGTRESTFECWEEDWIEIYDKNGHCISDEIPIEYTDEMMEAMLFGLNKGYWHGYSKGVDVGKDLKAKEMRKVLGLEKG